MACHGPAKRRAARTTLASSTHATYCSPASVSASAYAIGLSSPSGAPGESTHSGIWNDQLSVVSELPARSVIAAVALTVTVAGMSGSALSTIATLRASLESVSDASSNASPALATRTDDVDTVAGTIGSENVSPIGARYQTDCAFGLGARCTTTGAVRSTTSASG